MPNYKPLSKTTPDLVAEQAAKLKTLFPECVTEGRVDFDRLRATLGDLEALADDDAYTFTWAGKAEAFRALQAPSAASLRPAPEESVNWEATRHLFIEGENLEALKLLYKSYVGKVKMIYIDPPYNTGNDFIYRDDYSEPLRAYLEKTGQVDAEGNVLTSNPETRGRYHSDWLTMMYPRLFLARQLLRDDGVIFVSIDDHEVYHLRLLMNEIFGEENFVTTIIWQKVYAPKNTAKYFSEDHDYVVIYARNKEIWRPNLLPRTEEANARYENIDDDPRGPWKPGDLTARNYYSEGQYEVTSPSGKKFKPSIGTYWRVSYEKFQELDEESRIWWGVEGNNMPAIKRFLSDVKQGIVPQTLWSYEDVGHTQEAKKSLLKFVDFEQTENVLNTLKPPRLIQRMLQIGTDANAGDLVVDFFSGSASTAHAILAQNQEDGGNRRFIMVQYPEPLPEPEPHLDTIADMGRMRIRRVIANMEAEPPVQEMERAEPPAHEMELAEPPAPEPQLAMALEAPSGEENYATRNPQYGPGFKVFKLAPSTFRRWETTIEIEVDEEEDEDEPQDRADPEAGEDLREQLTYFDAGLKDDAEIAHVLYEVLLKLGFSLNCAVEPLPIAANTVYHIAQPPEEATGLDECYICLDEQIAIPTLDALPLTRETYFICLDTALSDAIKLNLAAQCELRVV